MPKQVSLGIFFCLFASTATGATGICKKDIDNAALDSGRRAAMFCVTDAAKRLERSNEPAGDVATAAVSTCQRQFATNFNIILKCYPAGAEMFDDADHDRARKMAIGVVVEIRADRAATPVPAPETAPSAATPPP